MTAGPRAEPLLHDLVTGPSQEPFSRHAHVFELHRPRSTGRKTHELWRLLDSHPRQLGGHGEQHLVTITKRRAEHNMLCLLGSCHPWRIPVEEKIAGALFGP